jgi:peptidoglycan hydrolase-like protein with peptidoglycan-binding domain
LAASSVVRVSSVGCALLLAGTLCLAKTSADVTSPKAHAKQPASKTHVSGKAAATTRKSHASSLHGKKRKTSSRRRGQQKIDAERTRQIQQALIRENYLQGEPSGVWDQQTQSALQRYQSANGWQSKTVPDSRALIRLGLGPNHDHLLNPDSAMTTSVPTPTSAMRDSSASPALGNATLGNQPQQ